MGVAGAALLYSCTPGIGRRPGRLPSCGSWAIRSIAPAPRAVHRRRSHRPAGLVAAIDPDASSATPARASAAASAARARRARLVGARAEHAPRSLDAASRLAAQARAAGLRLLHASTARPTGPSRPATPSPPTRSTSSRRRPRRCTSSASRRSSTSSPNKLWERMRIPPAWGDYIEHGVAAHRSDDLSAASISPTTARARPSCSNTTPTRRPRSTRPRSCNGTG